MDYMNTVLQTEEERKAFGLRLKSLRKERDLLQKEIAAKIGVKQTHFSRYESGVYIPPLDKATLLAEILGVTLDFLVTGIHPQEQPLQNTRLLERFHILETFTRGDQECVVTLIDAMIAKNKMKTLMEPMPL